MTLRREALYAIALTFAGFAAIAGCVLLYGVG
jgi:hypothetical protein